MSSEVIEVGHKPGTPRVPDDDDDDDDDSDDGW